VQNLQLRYANPKASDERRRNVNVNVPGRFEFEGREWDATSPDEEGMTLCVERERTFDVSLEHSLYAYSGPRPEAGEVLLLDDGGPRVRVRDVAPAHNDSRSGSFRAERIEDPAIVESWAAAMQRPLPNVTADVIADIRSELFRLGVAYPAVPRVDEITVTDHRGGNVALSASQGFDFHRFGTGPTILERLREFPTDAGPERIRCDFS
jgi:hypothetical protein